MVKQIIILLIIVNSFTLIACSNNQTTLSKQTGFLNNSNTSDIDKRGEREILIEVGDKTFTAIVYNNDSAKSIFDMLPFTLNMADANQNEKFYNLDNSLPTNPDRVGKLITVI